MSWLEAKIPVGHMVWTPGAPDPFGNTTPGWLPPVVLMTYGIAPGGSEPGSSAEPIPGRDAVVTNWQLLLPPDATPGPKDKYVIDGEEWEQVGLLLDYTRDPFGWSPGYVVNIKRVGG